MWAIPRRGGGPRQFAASSGDVAAIGAAALPSSYLGTRAQETRMARSHWLVKTEPSTYSWQDLVRDGSTRWDGVRNALARNHLGAMQKGDLVLVYHSGDEKSAVGIAKVERSAYPDPSADDARWLAVDLAALRPLAEPVSLATIKADPKLGGFALVRQSRLSVMPASAAEFAHILALANTKAPR
jgi:predicted RNA-binding protein with PUA-like domain